MTDKLHHAIIEGAAVSLAFTVAILAAATVFYLLDKLNDWVVSSLSRQEAKWVGAVVKFTVLILGTGLVFAIIDYCR